MFMAFLFLYVNFPTPQISSHLGSFSMVYDRIKSKIKTQSIIRNSFCIFLPRRPVWLALTLVYLLAIFPLAYSDQLTFRYLIENPSEIENMFWYVFGTFTNSLTFQGDKSWSNSKKSSTRLLIGKYAVDISKITN